MKAKRRELADVVAQEQDLEDELSGEKNKAVSPAVTGKCRKSHND